MAAAIQCIYRDLEYATSLVKAKAGKNAAAANAGANTADGAAVPPLLDDDDPEEESWTFVGGDETDTEQLGLSQPRITAPGSRFADVGPTDGQRSNSSSTADDSNASSRVATGTSS